MREKLDINDSKGFDDKLNAVVDEKFENFAVPTIQLKRIQSNLIELK